jgi:hypothetical protein
MTGPLRGIKFLSTSLTLFLLCAGLSCSGPEEQSRKMLPKSLRDVPASRLAYRLATDVSSPPANPDATDPNTKLPTVQLDFDLNRKSDALLRTVVSPDKLRALAIYATSDTPHGEFRMDLYGADGKLMRNILPQELSGAFYPTVAWSPDGQWIMFVGRKSQPSSPPTAPAGIEPSVSPIPASTPSTPPRLPVAVFSTEQIYICDHDGLNLKPLTLREGLIYFYAVWSPDGRAIAALACKEDEWTLRESQGRSPSGRPRIVELTGYERLLDDDSTDVLPVWSPDGSKVATAFESDVAIYDASSASPTAARIPLRDQLLAASSKYDEENLKADKMKLSQGKEDKKGIPLVQATPDVDIPLSFNPIVELRWLQPEMIFAQTGFVRIYDGKPITNYMRWHTVHISPQTTAFFRLYCFGREVFI